MSKKAKKRKKKGNKLSKLTFHCFLKGINTNQKLRIQGGGDAGVRGGPTGDLYVAIEVRPHPTLRREGNTIYFDTTVNYVDAILGSNIQVETVDGTVEVKVPPGTQPGTLLRLPNKGVPKMGYKDQRGD